MDIFKIFNSFICHLHTKALIEKQTIWGAVEVHIESVTTNRTPQNKQRCYICQFFANSISKIKCCSCTKYGLSRKKKKTMVQKVLAETPVI
jgi:uncharacterized paraquat-inducible protein A